MKTQQIKRLKISQGGFTLLELLVVVTLLAILAAGALVAFEGSEQRAQTATAAKTTGTLDQGVRAYRAVTGNYPNQWDNLANPVIPNAPAVSGAFIPVGLQNLLGSVNLRNVEIGLSTLTPGFSLIGYIETRLGMDEIQHVFGNGIGLNGAVEPNRAHNEGANPSIGTGGAVETEFGDFAAAGALPGIPANISILASEAFNGQGGQLGCRAGGVLINTAWNTNITPVLRPNRVNGINDALSTERCNLVLAIGFGGDAAHSTATSSVGISQAPSYSSRTVNPSFNYSRYVGLFLLAKGPRNGDDADDLASDGTAYGATVNAARAGNLRAQDFLPRPVFLGFIDAEGNTIDTNIATAARQAN